MARKYFTLVSRGNEHYHSGAWVAEFGDYSRGVVADEMAEMKERAKTDQEDISFKIITSGDTQTAINTAIAALNH